MQAKPKLRRILFVCDNIQYGIYEHIDGRVEVMKEILSDGGDKVSTGQGVTEQTARQAIVVNEAKL